MNGLLAADITFAIVSKLLFEELVACEQPWMNLLHFEFAVKLVICNYMVLQDCGKN